MSSSSLPLPPGGIGGRRTSSSGSSATGSGTYRRAASTSSSSLPPPPNMSPAKGSNINSNNGNTHYAQTLARSMTIEEMRALHRRALGEAEAKQTELRLVLASRYRELVGSSDEVTKMRERAQELHQLVHHLPELMEKLISTTEGKTLSLEKEQKGGETKEGESQADRELVELRQRLSYLPRLVHRALDQNNVHDATQSLMELFALIAQQTDEYPLATVLSKASLSSTQTKVDDTLLKAQMRMTYLHVQTLPIKIVRMAKQILHSSAAAKDPLHGAERSAAALSALDLLEIHEQQESRDQAAELLDLYFDSKAELLQELLGQLHTNSATAPSSTNKEDDYGKNMTLYSNNAEEILSKIVLILQYDIVLHPYQIFVLRKFPGSNPDSIMKSLPMFAAPTVQVKVSKFLSAHLPLIRTKVKSVLVEIAGTTASALGQIRQSLYDKTDGVECREKLDSNGICTWDEAVSGVVDVQRVLHNSSSQGGGPMAFVESTSTAMDRKFSLWGVLFSNTFSSLVHSLLTSSFQSVHTKVVSTLRLSLTNAPPLSMILPHEAYRNTLYIASELDAALIKVSDDAHELLVHAEEREESESRLRQSLYVQTCEIMGRLICELRRMLLISDSYDAVKHLIVGRLCHLLKFRLTVLSTLLDPSSSPAVLHGTTGMISLMELSSAFDLADDNDDGLITFQEAMEAVDSAFSGTPFHGAELVRETLLLPTSSDNDLSLKVSTGADTVTPQDVTLNELILLLARGLRHETSGKHSALGTIQDSLDSMMATCFNKWAQEVLKPYSSALSSHVQRFVEVTCNSSEQEYRRLYSSSDMLTSSVPSDLPVVSNVSPHVTAFLQEISFTLNRSVCPSDSLLPVPSVDYAVSMGVDGGQIPRIIDLIRWALLAQGLEAVVGVMKVHVGPALQSGASLAIKDSGPSGIAQLKNDLSFIHTCFFTRNQRGFGKGAEEELAKAELQTLTKTLDFLVRRVCDASTLRDIEERHKYVLEVCELFLSSLFGEETSTSVHVGDLGGGMGSLPYTGATPLYHQPLQSSCRFPLLPIQADRTLSGVQARGKYKEREEADQRSETIGGGAVRAGLGFFSNMLKKG